MKNLVHISNSDVLLVQETKLEDVDFLQATQYFCRNNEGLVVSTKGASVQLATLWKTSSFELVESQS